MGNGWWAAFVCGARESWGDALWWRRRRWCEEGQGEWWRQVVGGGGRCVHWWCRQWRWAQGKGTRKCWRKVFLVLVDIACHRSSWHCCPGEEGVWGWLMLLSNKRSNNICWCDRGHDKSWRKYAWEAGQTRQQLSWFFVQLLDFFIDFCSNNSSSSYQRDSNIGHGDLDESSKSWVELKSVAAAADDFIWNFDVSAKTLDFVRQSGLLFGDIFSLVFEAVQTLITVVTVFCVFGSFGLVFSDGDILHN